MKVMVPLVAERGRVYTINALSRDTRGALSRIGPLYSPIGPLAVRGR